MPPVFFLLACLLAAAGPDVRELRWTRSAGNILVLAGGAAGRAAVLEAGTAAAYVPDPDALKIAAARLLPDPVLRVDVLTAYDMYYYSRDPHTMTGGSEKPLPVWRVVFDDGHATWVHIDPATGAVLGRTDTTQRVKRWVFAMLHSWDWLPLLERRPVWDILVILLSLGGTALSVTGVVIGWRRLGLKFASLKARSS
jgi:hypothetical protein